MELIIKAQGLDDLMQSFVRMKENINEGYAKAIDESALILEGSAKENAPVNTGRLRASITHRLEFIKYVQAFAEIGTNVKYAPYVEMGTERHFPPIDAIQQWVRQKGIAGRKSATTGKRLGSKAARTAEDRGVAYAICRKIAMKGTKPQPFISTAYQRNIDRIVNKITEAIKQGIGES